MRNLLISRVYKRLFLHWQTCVVFLDHITHKSASSPGDWYVVFCLSHQPRRHIFAALRSPCVRALRTQGVVMFGRVYPQNREQQQERDRSSGLSTASDHYLPALPLCSCLRTPGVCQAARYCDRDTIRYILTIICDWDLHVKLILSL